MTLYTVKTAATTVFGGLRTYGGMAASSGCGPSTSASSSHQKVIILFGLRNNNKPLLQTSRVMLKHQQQSVRRYTIRERWEDFKMIFGGKQLDSYATRFTKGYYRVDRLDPTKWCLIYCQKVTGISSWVEMVYFFGFILLPAWIAESLLAGDESIFDPNRRVYDALNALTPTDRYGMIILGIFLVASGSSIYRLHGRRLYQNIENAHEYCYVYKNPIMLYRRRFFNHRKDLDTVRNQWDNHWLFMWSVPFPNRMKQSVYWAPFKQSVQATFLGNVKIRRKRAMIYPEHFRQLHHYHYLMRVSNMTPKLTFEEHHTLRPGVVGEGKPKSAREVLQTLPMDKLKRDGVKTTYQKPKRRDRTDNVINQDNEEHDEWKLRPKQ